MSPLRRSSTPDELLPVESIFGARLPTSKPPLEGHVVAAWTATPRQAAGWHAFLSNRWNPSAAAEMVGAQYCIRHGKPRPFGTPTYCTWWQGCVTGTGRCPKGLGLGLGLGLGATQGLRVALPTSVPTDLHWSPENALPSLTARFGALDCTFWASTVPTIIPSSGIRHRLPALSVRLSLGTLGVLPPMARPRVSSTSSPSSAAPIDSIQNRKAKGVEKKARRVPTEKGAA